MAIKKIDVGCGGTKKRCAPGYDIYCDIVEPELNLPGKYVRCAMEKMPFADKEFDFSRCHHAIEHCEDPDKACAELIRISKAGILSFPPAQAELMFGRRDHRWFCFVDRGRLLFVKKRHASYGVARAVTRCELNVNFSWERGFSWQVVN